MTAVDAWAWWLVALAVLALIEALTHDLVFAMLGAAAAVTSGLEGLADVGFGGQSLCFVIAAALALALVRPAALDRLKPPTAAR
jgi:membrane protein implicated in regulation of membrane protease activity